MDKSQIFANHWINWDHRWLKKKEFKLVVIFNTKFDKKELTKESCIETKLGFSIYRTLHIATLILPAMILKIVSFYDSPISVVRAAHWLLC